MKCLLALALGLIALLPSMANTATLTTCNAVSTPNEKMDEDTIRSIEEGWLTAGYRGNKQFLECLLGADF